MVQDASSCVNSFTHIPADDVELSVSVHAEKSWDIEFMDKILVRRLYTADYVREVGLGRFYCDVSESMQCCPDYHTSRAVAKLASNN